MAFEQFHQVAVFGDDDSGGFFCGQENLVVFRIAHAQGSEMESFSVSALVNVMGADDQRDNRFAIQIEG